jgi:PTS system nitrogen regulatory IIA component
MQMSDLIKPEQVLAASPAANKMELLQELARGAASEVGVDAQTILAALFAREELGSSGVGAGVALPHTRIPGLRRYFGLFARLVQPIEFSAVDGQPVDLVFVLLIPTSAGNDHLAALACVSRRLRNRAVSLQLRAAPTVRELYNLLVGPVVAA